MTYIRCSEVRTRRSLRKTSYDNGITQQLLYGSTKPGNPKDGPGGRASKDDLRRLV